MDTAQQIAALKEALAALDAAIVQTQATLALATTQQDIASLQSSLIELRSERNRTQSLLDSLESAAVVVAPLAAGPMAGVAGAAMARVAAVRGAAAKAGGQMRTLRKDLKSSTAATTVVKATVGFADDVTRRARALRISAVKTLMVVGNDPTVPTGRPRPRATAKRIGALGRAAKAAKRRG